MSANTTRNPLSVILGAYLKRERNNARRSSSEIAEQLFLGESIYRMIEAGSANLNINRISLLISVFEESSIQFERLAKYMAAIQIFEFETAKKTDLRYILSLIGDADLEYFFTKIIDLFKLSYGTDEYKNILDEIAVKELSSYLGASNYRTKEVSTFKNDAVNVLFDVPSIEVPNILSFLKSLSNRQPLHVGPVAKEWEENMNGLTLLRGFYTRAEIIISESNLDLFLYDYLFKDTFIGLKMIFVEDRYSAKTLEEKFIHKLNASRRNYEKKLLSKVQENKIQFKTIASKDKTYSEDITSLLKGREDIFQHLDAYWNFTHSSGIEIGFVGGAASEKNYAMNISSKDSFERTRVFDTIWNNI
ncbi:MAG: hypothetical protein U0V75_00160 [Ferruginibacter sp.]